MSDISLDPNPPRVLYAADPVTSTESVSASSGPPDTPSQGRLSRLTPSATASVSGRAKLLSQLKTLAQNNPAEFKQATADIATQLQAASQQSSSGTGNALSTLAAKFQQAAQTGSANALLPAKHHHSGHHGTAITAASAAYAQNAAPAAGGVKAQANAIISSVLSQGADSSAGPTSNLFRLPQQAAA